MAMITAVKTRVLTQKYSESLEFYTQVLDLRIVEQWDREGDKGAILGLGDKRADGFIELGWSAQETEISGICLQFRVADISVFMDSLASAWQHSEPTLKPWGSTYVELLDPNGIPLIVFEGDV
jgi:catechol 2,3-dioxygenase-like lactoylglutathione lyase family enzyme